LGTWGPAEADAVLIVDADAVLAGAIAREGLEAIPGRHAQIVEPPGDLQLKPLASCHGGDLREAPGTTATGERLGVAIAQRDEHAE
jgi:hypothetical protein